MKSILTILEVQKLPFLAVLEVPNFDFDKFLTSKIHKNQNSEPLKIAKIVVFETSKYVKIDFTENLSGRKILKFQHCERQTIYVLVRTRLMYQIGFM